MIIGTLGGLLKIHYDQIRKTADPVKVEQEKSPLSILIGKTVIFAAPYTEIIIQPVSIAKQQIYGIILQALMDIQLSFHLFDHRRICHICILQKIYKGQIGCKNLWSGLRTGLFFFKYGDYFNILFFLNIVELCQSVVGLCRHQEIGTLILAIDIDSCRRGWGCIYNPCFSGQRITNAVVDSGGVHGKTDGMKNKGTVFLDRLRSSIQCGASVPQIIGKFWMLFIVFFSGDHAEGFADRISGCGTADPKSCILSDQRSSTLVVYKDLNLTFAFSAGTHISGRQKAILFTVKGVIICLDRNNKSRKRFPAGKDVFCVSIISCPAVNLACFRGVGGNTAKAKA